MGYIIYIDNLDKILNPEEFKEHLKKIYSLTKFLAISDPDRPYSHEWEATTTNKSVIEGFLHKDGNSIHIDGQFEDCADFVLNARTILLKSGKTLFFDNSYNYNIEVTPHTTKNDIVKVFSE
jgi:hypothetical protein